ncbi:MAG: hypothetical protein HZA21_01655 [Nitrospirae bacterium]|nr:hypothetical protein [Nitrospirota bacterium]
MVRSPKPADEKDYSQSKRTGRRSVAAVSLVLMGVALGGCVVADSTYQAAVAESEEVKAALERTQTQTNALEQQAKSIKDQMDKLTTEAASASAELQRLQGSRDAEREEMEEQVHKLEQEVAKLSAQHKALQHQHASVEKENESLKATVARYQKELKDRSQPTSSASQSAGSKPVLPLAASKTQEAQSGPVTAAKGSPTQEGSAPSLDAPKQQEVPAASSPGKEEAPPAEEPTGFLALIKRWLASIWHLIF